MHAGVTKGGVAYSYAGPGTAGVTKGGVAYSYAGPGTSSGTSKGGGVTKGGVAYSYGPGPAVSQPPASLLHPSQNYYSGYGAPSTGMYHYAHGHSAPPAQQYAPHTQTPLL